MIEFTRKKYLELYLNGEPVKASGRSSNRHTTLVEAAEHATEHAAEVDAAGSYEIRVGSEVFYTVVVTATDVGVPDPVDDPVTTTINHIPDISMELGSSYDLRQYVAGPILGSQVLNLDSAVGIYNHSSGLLTAIGEGNMSGLQLEVTI